MKTFFMALVLLTPTLAVAGEEATPPSELSLGGIAIGDSPSEVVGKHGEPLRKSITPDFLDLHYDYPQVRVSFSDDVVAGLYSDKANGCTPKGLCPGDSLKKMRAMYGPPASTVRDKKRFYEYYAADASCWLQIKSMRKKIASIAVACQP